MKFWPTITLSLCALAAASCNREHKRVIAVIPKGQAHIFWQAIHAGAVAAGNEFGAEIRWNGPASEIDLTRQINIVDDFINQHVDGIALPRRRTANRWCPWWSARSRRRFR